MRGLSRAGNGRAAAFAAAIAVVALVSIGSAASPSVISPPDLTSTASSGDGSFVPAAGDARGGLAIVHHAGGILLVATGVTGSTVLLHRTGYLGIEPTLGTDARGRVFAAAKRNDGVVLESLVIRSTDQGATWKDVSPSVGPVNPHAYSEDPYIYVDPATGRLFDDDLIVPCQLLSSSDNAGASWHHTLVACDESDHQTIFAGPPSTTAPVGYPGVVYDCAIGGGALSPTSTTTECDRSLDGGRTFLPGAPAFVAPLGRGPGAYGIPGFCDGATGHGFVGPDGTVYLPRGWCGQPWLATSRNEGLSWKRVQVASNGMPVDASGAFDHEAGAVADAAGNVYYFWVAHDRLPYLAVSRDHGRTWGSPMMIGAPGLKESSLPAIAIGGSGKIAMAYMGSTNSPGSPFPNELDCPPNKLVRFLLNCPDPPVYARVTWNGYVTTTASALDPSPTFVTSSINDLSDPLIVGTCGPIRCGAEFDFIAVQVAPDGTPWAAFIDACAPTLKCARAGELVVAHLIGDPSLR